MVNPNPMLSAQMGQVEQLRAAVRRLTVEKELYVRLTILLSNAMVAGLPVPMAGENLCIPVKAYEAVPSAFSLNVTPVRIKEDRELEEGEEEIPEVDMLMIQVEKKTGTNGKVAVADRPRLIIP